MTAELSVFVCIPETAVEHVLELRTRAEASLARSRKSPPGDRTESGRFEALHTVIDQLAAASLANGEPSFVAEIEADSVSGTSVLTGNEETHGEIPADVQRWINSGRVVVELRLPHGLGGTKTGGTIGVGPTPPATRWISTKNRPRDSVRERFEHLINCAVSLDDRHSAAICPSGIDNSVLTETLRDFVDHAQTTTRMELPVRYRDGSHGPSFPLRALDLVDSAPIGWMVLRFTLLSIRHVEMDEIVDGAWLRNSKVSRNREAGLTDQIVYETSLRQLAFLAERGPVVIHMYQTGLQPAIMGFYRAVVDHLLTNPKDIAVVPQYFVGDGKFLTGRTWAAR